MEVAARPRSRDLMTVIGFRASLGNPYAGSRAVGLVSGCAAWDGSNCFCRDAIGDPERRAIEEDFKSEFLLRKSEPPYQLVREEFERFTAEFDRAMRDLETEDPSRFEEMGKEIERDLEAFKSTRDRTKS
jgi:hypothetical protein